MGEKGNLQCLKSTINIRIFINASFSILRQKFSTISRVSIITLGICANVCVFSNSSLASRKIWKRSLVNYLSAKQNDRSVWLDVQYLLIWCPNKNLHLYKSCVLNVCDQVSLNFSNHDLFKWSHFYDRIPNAKILHLDPHRFAILYKRSTGYPTIARKFCVIPVTNYWTHMIFP